MNRIVRCIAVLCVMATLALVRPAAAETYRNAEYGFDVAIPRGLKICIGEPYQHDTGIRIWLVGGPRYCDDRIKRRFIGVVASYNGPLWPSAEAAVDALCTDGRRVEPPPGLSFKSRPSAVCKVGRGDGWVYVLVVTMGWRWPGESVSSDSAPYIQYDVSLETMAERLPADLKRLHAVLNALRISNPGR